MNPWHGDDAFNEVLKLIDPRNQVKPPIEACEWARDRLILWQVKATSHHCLPEIEATLSLLTAIIKDRHCLDGPIDRDPRLTNKCYDICTFYGMSIVKFCNLLPYYDMTKRRKIIRLHKKSKKTVRDLGISLDLPTWVLECRHKTCHASTNSLTLLRSANSFALSWIFRHFWYKMLEEEEASKSNDRLSKLGKKVAKWLVISAGSKKVALTEKIAQTVADHPDQSISILVDILVKESSSKLFDSGMDLGELPVRIIKPYAKIVRLIANIESLELFLHHLIKYFMDSDGRKAKISVLWFKTIAKCLSREADVNIKHMLSLPELNSDIAIIIWHRMLYKATKNLSQFTPELVDHLSSLMPEDYISQKTTEMLKQFAILSNCVSNDKSNRLVESNGKELISVKTLDDVITELSNCEQKMNTS